MLAKWFDEKGMLKVEDVQRAKSVYDIITPSPERAYALNKAYLTIVKEQSYLFGRDATLTKATNVLSTIDADQPPYVGQVTILELALDVHHINRKLPQPVDQSRQRLLDPPQNREIATELGPIAQRALNLLERRECRFGGAVDIGQKTKLLIVLAPT